MTSPKHKPSRMSVEIGPPLDTERALQTQATALQRYVGIGRAVNLDTLSERTGIGRRALQSYVRGDRLAPWPALLAVLAALGRDGPEAANVLLAHAGLGGVACAAPAEINPHTTLSALCEEARELAERLSDGVFCASDRAAMAKRLMALGTQLQEQSRAMAQPLRAV